MRRTLVWIALVVVALAPGAHANAKGAPSLRLADRAPLTVTGANFKRREIVRMTASLEDETATHTVRTGARGDFTARFLKLSAGRCDELRVVARGSTGTKAVLKIFPPLTCQPLATSERSAS